MITFATRRVLRFAHLLAASLLAYASPLPVLASEQAPVLDFRLNEQVIDVPAGPGRSARLQTTVFRPNGPGPFPLLIINHGKEAGAPQSQPRERFIVMATAFVKRGYAVLVPMRQGFAASTGRYADFGCDMTANGYAQASDVGDVLTYARRQPWIDGEHIVVAGQSYGGLATLALGTSKLPGVRGLINFAGGLRDDGAQCDWRGQLVHAFGEYGEHNQIPSLWLYGLNDSLFGPELVDRLHQAFARAGGRVRLIQFGAFKRDAHGMLASRDGEKIWWRDTERFLRELGMPTDEVVAVGAAPIPPKSNFARLDDVAAVPYLSEAGRAAYRDYLNKMTPRAFAVSPNGAWCWAEEGEEPDARALAACASKSQQACQLYSVDHDVVWQGQQATAAGAVGGSGH
jgi:dienelactone hydrolase